MIACLRGVLYQRSMDKVIVLTQGVGYEVRVSLSSLERLPAEGERVFLYTYTHVREDLLQLYGFADLAEKEMFLLLVSVAGVGPKMAMAILSGTGPGELANAILSGDIARLTRLPGVGKKTAERLCLELKEKIPTLTSVRPAEIPRGQIPPELELMEKRVLDVISALVNLGYPQPKAQKAVAALKKTVSEDVFQSLGLSELLRKTLRSLA